MSIEKLAGGTILNIEREDGFVGLRVLLEDGREVVAWCEADNWAHKANLDIREPD